jgi:FkbM family methyltransferase
VSAKERILHTATRSDFVRGAYGVLRGIPMLGAGVHKLVHAAMPLGTKLWIRIPDGLGRGFWIHADPRFELGYTNGDHEPWIQELLKAELRSGDCYYDLGAHTGFFSLIASRFVGPFGRIVAFEPDPQNAAAFKANIAKNGLTQVTVVEMAVWSSSGPVAFEPATDSSNRTQGYVSSGADARFNGVSVSAVRLDDFVLSEGYPTPRFIKMDVEGAEWEALRGARRLLTEAQPKLLCEVHDPAQMSQIRTYLESLGYMAEEWEPVHPHYSDYRQLYLWATAKR